MRSVPFSMSETWEGGKFGPTQQVTFRDKSGVHTVNISAGTQDEVEVFREGDTTYVLAVNRRLDYAGLESFQQGEPSGDIFVQGDDNAREFLGPRGLKLTNVHLARKLAGYMGYI